MWLLALLYKNTVQLHKNWSKQDGGTEGSMDWLSESGSLMPLLGGAVSATSLMSEAEYCRVIG